MVMMMSFTLNAILVSLSRIVTKPYASEAREKFLIKVMIF